MMREVKSLKFKILSKETIAIEPNSEDDLKIINLLLDDGDRLETITTRKIKPTEKAVERKPMLIEILISKCEQEDKTIRCSGIVTKGPEEVRKGSWHSLTIELGKKIKLTKQFWLKWQIEKLLEASKPLPRILMVVLDRNEAIFGLLEKSKIKQMAKFSQAFGKRYKIEKEEEFFDLIAKNVAKFFDRFKPKHVVLASPAFWKEIVYEKLKKELKEISILTNCSVVEEVAFDEIVKSEELKRVLAADKARRELKIFDSFLENLKEKKASYNYETILEALEQGKISQLLISEKKFIELKKQAEFFKKIELKKGKIIIFSSALASPKLESLGGLAAIFKYE